MKNIRHAALFPVAKGTMVWNTVFNAMSTLATGTPA
jgi:hypothetical protein